MRTFGTILALLLIFFGLVVAGLVFVRIWQDNGLLRVDINTANVSVPPVNASIGESPAEIVVSSERAAEGGAVAATGAGAQVVGIESGGMSLEAQGTAAALAAPADAPPADAPPVAATAPPVDAPPPVELQPIVDPCLPAPAQGFAADTAVVAVGMLRVYSQADVTSPALRDLSAGQGLWIVAGEGGGTAIKRCEVIWQRVRTADGLVGWVLADAIDVTLPTIVAPTAVPTVTISPCVGGCGQQGGQQGGPQGCTQPCPTPCNQPCPTPCYQPCPTPCTTPCGVYTQ